MNHQRNVDCIHIFSFLSLLLSTESFHLPCISFQAGMQAHCFPTVNLIKFSLMSNDLGAYNSNLIKYHAILEHVKSDEKAFQKYDFRINYSQENIKVSIL